MSGHDDFRALRGQPAEAKPVDNPDLRRTPPAPSPCAVCRLYEKHAARGECAEPRPGLITADVSREDLVRLDPPRALTYKHNRLSRWLRWPHLLYSKTARCHYIERCDCDIQERLRREHSDESVGAWAVRRARERGVAMARPKTSERHTEAAGEERGAPTVGASETDIMADDMCENCVTPWKCNGPHILSPGARAEKPS